MTGIMHHKYDERGTLRIWNTVRAITIWGHQDGVVVVELHGIPVLRFDSAQPQLDAGFLANLIFQTDKEWAS